MTRVKSILSICFLALFGALAAASAVPLPASPQTQAGVFARVADYERCYWRNGYRLCRTYDDDYEDDGDDDYDYDTPAYSYYGSPGIYLGFGGIGFGRGHGGFHHGGGGHGRH